MKSMKKGAAKARGRAIKKRKVESTRPFSRAGPATAISKRNKAELKYFDSTGGAAVPASAAWAATMQDPTALPVANINCLFAPVQGNAISNRVGRKVTVWKIKIRGVVLCAAQTAQSTGDAGTMVRVLCVVDKQTNAAQMTGAQLIGDVVNANTNLFSFQNPDQFGRFRVLKDKTMLFQNASQTGSPTAADVIQQGLVRNLKMSFRFKKGMDIHFNATNGGTIADIIDNSFHIVANASSTNYGPTLSYTCRVTYSDA